MVLRQKHINKWVVAAMFAVVQFGAYGTTQGCFGLFIKPIEFETGWSRTAISLAPSILLATNFIASIWWGLLSDKWSIKGVLFLSGLFLSIGFFASSNSTTLMAIYLFFGVIGGIGVGGSAAPLAGLAARWFQNQKGLGIGIGFSGVSIGTGLLPLIVNPSIQNYGWRSSFVLLGTISLACYWIGALILREPSKDVNPSQPVANPLKLQDCNGKVISTIYVSTALKSRNFWVLFIVHILGVFVLQMTMIHIIPSAIENGISPITSAFILLVVGFLSIIGKIGGGVLGDTLGNRKILLTAFLLQSLALIFINSFTDLWSYFFFAALFGLSYGMWSPQVPAMAGNAFGTTNLGAIMGALYPSGAIGGFTGPVFAGLIFDHFGNYILAFYTGTVVCIITAIISLLMDQNGQSKKLGVH